MPFIFILLIFIFQSANSGQLGLPDSHAPISIMADHTHTKGEIMFSYRLMKMQMNKLLNNKKHMTVDEVMNSPNGASDGSANYIKMWGFAFYYTS